MQSEYKTSPLFQVASSCFTKCALNTQKWLNCGWDLQYSGLLSMIRPTYRKFFCHLFAWRNHFFTSSYDLILGWFLRNVNICKLGKSFFIYFDIFVSGDVWKVHRKSLNYSFNLKILQTFIPTFIENAQKLVNDLSSNLGKTKEFDMLAYTSKSALDMICGKNWKYLELMLSITFS